MFQTLRAFKFWLENVIHFQKQIFYIDELLLERLAPRTVTPLWMWLGQWIGCQFHGYFVLFAKLSFKETSWIKSGAYNRQNNMHSHILTLSIQSVGIISSHTFTLQSSHQKQDTCETTDMTGIQTIKYTVNTFLHVLLFINSLFCIFLGKFLLFIAPGSSQRSSRRLIQNVFISTPPSLVCSRISG